jgi:hypothetical protein
MSGSPRTPAQAPPAHEPLRALDLDLFVATRPLRLWIGDIGCRMTVIRLADGGLFLHSPVPLDDAIRQALDREGRVEFLIGPSKVHHFYLGDYARAYPDALLCGAPGLSEKRKDLDFNWVIDDAVAPPWGDEIQMRLFRGAPLMNEVVFFHPATRTLLLTDLAFNVPPDGGGARLFHRLVGATGRFGPHVGIRLGIRDRRAARAALEAILAWDFDRVVVTHGDVLESGGRSALREAFAFLLRQGAWRCEPATSGGVAARARTVRPRATARCPARAPGSRRSCS